MEKSEKKVKDTGNILPGHFPLSLRTFPLNLKHNTMQCAIQNMWKIYYYKFMVIKM